MIKKHVILLDHEDTLKIEHQFYLKNVNKEILQFLIMQEKKEYINDYILKLQQSILKYNLYINNFLQQFFEIDQIRYYNFDFKNDTLTIEVEEKNA